MPVEIRSDRWPMVEVIFRGRPSHQEFQSYLDQLAAILDRREPYVMLTDSGDSPGIPANSRADLGRFMKARSDDFDSFQIAHAVVIRSTIQRGMLTALSWVAPIPGGVHAVADLDQGIAHLRTRWKETQGVELPR